MIRNSLDPSSPYFSIFITKNGTAPDLFIQQRGTVGGSTTSDSDQTKHNRSLWLRVTKVGNVFQAYVKNSDATISSIEMRNKLTTLDGIAKMKCNNDFPECNGSCYATLDSRSWKCSKYGTDVGLASGSPLSCSNLTPCSPSSCYMGLCCEVLEVTRWTCARPYDWVKFREPKTVNFSTGQFYAGIAVTSHDNSKTATLAASDYSITNSLANNFGAVEIPDVESSRNIEVKSGYENVLQFHTASDYQNVSVWYEAMDSTQGFRSNTYSSAHTLCASKGESLASLSQICHQGKPHHGHKYGEQWAPVSDCNNCWVQVGTHDSCKTYHDLHGELPSWGENTDVEKPWARFTMCIAKDEPHPDGTKISKMIEQLELNEKMTHAEVGDGLMQIRRIDDFLANSYMAFWLSEQRELDVSGLLGPLGKFGDFIKGMVPAISATKQMYIKVPLFGLPEFILGFIATTKFDCKPLADLADVIKSLDWTADKIISKTVFPQQVIDFCRSDGGQSLSTKFSVGYKGYYPDIPNTFVQLTKHDGGLFKISMDILPTCPPPVKVGGKCSNNDDCRNHIDDYEKQYESGSGYCKFGKVAGISTSIGCSGRCIDKLSPGGDCSKPGLNIMDIDPSFIGKRGDSNACKSGQCTCGRCAELNKKVPDGAKCSENNDCESGYCLNNPVSKVSVDCQGTCMAKLVKGGDCGKDAMNISPADVTHWDAAGDSNACISGQCTCGRCTDGSRKAVNGAGCSENTDCSSGWCLSNNDVTTVGCNGNCREKLEPGADCSPEATRDIWKKAPWDASHAACKSGHCYCSRCTNIGSGRLAPGHRCSLDSDCESWRCRRCDGFLWSCIDCHGWCE